MYFIFLDTWCKKISCCLKVRCIVLHFIVHDCVYLCLCVNQLNALCEHSGPSATHPASLPHWITNNRCEAPAACPPSSQGRAGQWTPRCSNSGLPARSKTFTPSSTQEGGSWHRRVLWTNAPVSGLIWQVILYSEWGSMEAVFSCIWRMRQPLRVGPWKASNNKYGYMTPVFSLLHTAETLRTKFSPETDCTKIFMLLMFFRVILTGMSR